VRALFGARAAGAAAISQRGPRGSGGAVVCAAALLEAPLAQVAEADVLGRPSFALVARQAGRPAPDSP
jgi:hypothetical protein